jgi:polyisoprenoid-binding protein YceI
LFYIQFQIPQMKKLIILTTIFLIQFSLSAQSTWTLDKVHSKVGFTVTHHMISEVDGYFAEFEGSMINTKEDFSDATFTLNIKTASINTQFEIRDNHLKSADIFDVVKYPTISFVSSSITHVAGNRYKLNGALTMKATTLPISLDLTIVGTNKNDQAKRFEIGVKGITKLSRLAYSVGTNLSVFSVSDEVELRLTGEFDKSF